MITFNPFNLTGKRILVTGASSGIGRGIAIACAKMGGTMVINGRNEAKLQETLTQMCVGGGEDADNQIVTADLSDTQNLPAMVATLPNLDGIVHCAGIGQRVLCKQLAESDLDVMMSTNFKAPVMLQTELLRQKKVNKSASIVFISSIAADSPVIGNAIYSASKGAILSYANCLAQELAPRLIRVNCIQPAMVWTNLAFSGGIAEEDLKEDEKRYPLKRYGKPEDIANLAIYMLSDAAAWMTGSNVKITGGIIKL